MTAAPARSARPAGFTLFEVILVIILLAVVFNLATAVMLQGRKRLRDTTDAAHARAEITVAADRMRRDIRSAMAVTVGKQSLMLGRPDGSIVIWQLRKSRLMRTGPKGRRTYLAPVTDLRPRLEEKSSPAPFVEVAVQLARTGRTRGRVLYVGARPRVREAAR